MAQLADASLPACWFFSPFAIKILFLAGVGAGFAVQVGLEPPPGAGGDGGTPGGFGAGNYSRGFGGF